MISIDISLVVVIMNFILLIIILNKVAFKPLREMLEKRQNQIKDDIDSAEKSKEEAKNLLMAQEDEHRKATTEARHLREKIKKEAQIEADKIIEVAHQQNKKLLAEGEKRLELESKKTMKELEGELAGLVAQLSEKVLDEKLDSPKDKELIQKMIQNRGK
ncbi:MAG: F0F1 ATP synthase subunit B [Candidatus Zophobacter franzmannii]|jgi:F-type H+-transporting ATPase subunit b|nr:F0F1 ATP synthase subunit B [Candidatus Zophobacter franzmannii]